MHKLIIDNKIIDFNYYYKRVFDPMYKSDRITNFNIPKIINNYYIIKGIYVLQYEILDNYIENLDRKLKFNEEYREISDYLNHHFLNYKSIVDIASFSYCLSRKNHIVLKIELDLIFTDINKLIEDAFRNFLTFEEIEQIKYIYSQILYNYYNNAKEKFYSGVFLYTDFKLNEVVLNTFLKRVLFAIFGSKLNFIVYKNSLLIFCPNAKKKSEYRKKIKSCMLPYYIYFKNQISYDLTGEDIIFKNNVILENYSCILKEKTFEFLKWQMEQKIEQEIPLSPASETLLLEYISGRDYNKFKNNIMLKEAEYYKKIKYYYDIMTKNGCY